MALFSYKAVDAEGAQRTGTIDAVNIDVAIAALQRRGLVISAIDPQEVKMSLQSRLSFFDRVTNADIVMISRQITTLFEAQVSALRAFRLLAAEARTPKLGERLSAVASDIQSGSTISSALARHPDVFLGVLIQHKGGGGGGRGGPRRARWTAVLRSSSTLPT